MYLLIQSQILNIEVWHLGLTVIAIIISLAIMFINIERSRKKDLSKHLEKKADKIEVENLEKRIEKLDEDCTEKTKELKTDFIKQVDKLNDKFDKLVNQIIDIIKDKKK